MKLKKLNTITAIREGLLDIHDRAPKCKGWAYCKCDVAEAIRALDRYLEKHDPNMTGRV